MSGQQLEVSAVSACIESELENYEALLEGQQATDIHRLVMDQAERAVINYALRRVQGNQSQAACMLGISRGTLRKKVREYELG
ncbi:MAG: helix-turn-helix domain-containing protein [Granulosicoccaceae bacterium]